MDISVCMVNFNAEKYLIKCLQSLENAISPLSYEVIIVDNKSKDSTIKLLRKHFNDINFVCNDYNLGYTSEINKAMKLGRGKYKLILNPDTILKDKSIFRLVNFMKTNKEIGITGPKVLNEDGSFQKSCRRGLARPSAVFCYFLGLAKLFPKNKNLTGYQLNHLDENQINKVKGVSGSCMLIDQNVIKDIGYFDEKFFAYQEDSDYCLRAIEKGWAVYYNPNAIVYHKSGHGGSHSVPYLSIFEWHRSYYYYYLKHFSKEHSLLFNFFYISIMLYKLIFSEINFMLRK